MSCQSFLSGVLTIMLPFVWLAEANAAPFLVRDINPGGLGRCSIYQGSDPRGGVKVGDSFFFNACGAYGDCQLWKTDGTPGGTVQVSHNLSTYTCELSPRSITEVDGRVFFLAGESGGGNRPSDEQLWVSDGTSEGTVRLTDFPDSADPADLIEMAGHLFFTVWDGTSPELWRSDGTALGTVPLMSFPSWRNPRNFDSNSWDLTNVDGTLFFARCQKATGCELWKSDGTADGTVRVAVITPPGSYEDFPLDERYPWGLVEFTPFDDRLFFLACERYGQCELWRSDGSEAGTVRVTQFRPTKPPVDDEGWDHSDLAAANGRVFFRSCQPHVSGDWHCNLWKSDGTPGGTVQVLDLGPGFPEMFTSVGGTLFFRGKGGLWKSDGTAAGTVSLGIRSERWTDVRGTLFLTAYDPVRRAYQLWRSDGTDAGTFALTDVPDRTFILAEVDGTLFLNIDDQERGAELFGLALCGGEPGPCDPVTGECASPPWSCDDGDPCTADGCDPGIGCTHTVTDECLPTSTSTTATSTTTSTSTRALSTTTTSTELPISTTSTTLTCPFGTAALCDDDDLCTVDTCEGGRCYHQLRPGLDGVLCRLRHHAPPSLACQDSISKRLELRLKRASRFVSRAVHAGNQRKARRRIRRATHQLEVARNLLAKGGTHRMGFACADALERAIAQASAGMNHWLATGRGG